MIDHNTTKRTAARTTAGTSYTAAIDTGSPLGVGNIVGQCKLRLTNPLIDGLTNAKTVTFTVQDSADNSDFADVVGLPARAVTGAGGLGGAAGTINWEWSTPLRRYIRVKEVVEATPGTIIAYNYDFSLVLQGTPGI